MFWSPTALINACRTGNSLGLVADEIDLSFQAASLVPADQFLLLHAAHHNAGCNAQPVGKLWNFRYREFFQALLVLARNKERLRKRICFFLRCIAELVR